MRIKKTVTIPVKLDIREIIRFVEIARSFSCHIMICHGKSTVNGKGLLGLISFFFGLEEGERLVLTAAGPDSEQALEKLVGFFYTVPKQERLSYVEASR
jgi:phosphotransferase system HPr (HPr) family protein